MVDLATMGKFSKAVGVGTGGGAPPTRYKDNKPTPYIKVLSIDLKKAPVSEMRSIKVRLVSQDGGVQC